MCGIAGYLTAVPGEAPDLDAMRESLVHRGPDDAGTVVLDGHRVGLANRRLSILDLSPQGHQPMSNEDGSVWVTFNGEIYNHRELRAGLAARHRFRSRTDTEVLVHLWEERGPRMVDALTGMFAFAVWDARARTLFLARDRLGQKPLYLVRLPNGIAFASEVKAFLAAGLVRAALDERALGVFLNHGFVPGRGTLFRGVEKLEPGCSLTVDAVGAVASTRWWELPPEAPEDRPEEALVDEILRLLRDSVRLQLAADVPVGVFLSGGVDSGIVAALAAGEQRGIRTFTAGFDDGAGDERGTARALAAHLGTDHRDMAVSPEDFLESLRVVARHQEEPVWNPIWSVTFLLARLAAESGVPVVLTGDGGDELFAGYDRWMRLLSLDPWWRMYSRLPRPVRKAAHRAGSGMPLGRTAREALRAAADGEALYRGSSMFRRHEVEQLLRPELLADWRSHASAPLEEIRARFTSEGGGDLVRWMTCASLRTVFVEDYLMRLDKMGMAVSVEGRSPLLDHRLVELAVALPSNVKVPRGERKLLLRRVADRLLPAGRANARKVGFCAPLESWMLRRPLRPLLAEALERLGDVYPDLFVRETLAAMRRRADDGHIHAPTAWALVTLALWHETWIAGHQEAAR